MKVWRPKRKKSENEELIAQAEVAKAHSPAEQLRRIKISSVHMAAAVPVVVGLGLLILFPFLVADHAPSPSGENGSGGQGKTGPGPRDPRLVPSEHPGLPPRIEGGNGSGDAPGLTAPRPDPELDRAIQATLDDSIRYEDRVASLDHLARSRDSRAMDALLAAAVSRDGDTRTLAGRGLSRWLPDPRAADALRLLLQDTVTSVAESVAIELGKGSLGRELLVGRLHLPDPEGQVHLTCIRGLLYQGTEEDVPLLMRWVRDEGRLGEAAVETVWSICTRTGLPPPPGLPRRLR